MEILDPESVISPPNGSEKQNVESVKKISQNVANREKDQFSHNSDYTLLFDNWGL